MKTVLIPGGTGALGAYVSRRILADGYRVVVPYRDPDDAERLRVSLPAADADRLALIMADVTVENDVKRLEDLLAESDPLHALVHLVGGVRAFAPVADTETEDWYGLLALNLHSFFLCARLAMRRFRDGGGRIVSVGAMAAIKPSARQGAYAVAKAGVVALTKVLADEGRMSGITANCIAPSIVRTPANLAWGSAEDAASWVTPEEIAETVAFLLSDAAAGVNGSVIQTFGRMNV